MKVTAWISATACLLLTARASATAGRPNLKMLVMYRFKNFIKLNGRSAIIVEYQVDYLKVCTPSKKISSMSTVKESNLSLTYNFVSI
jgi:hypothetical protein